MLLSVSLSSGSEKRASLSALGGRNVLLCLSQLWEGETCFSLSSGREKRASLCLSQLWEGETCFSLSLSALGGRNVLLSVSLRVELLHFTLSIKCLSLDSHTPSHSTHILLLHATADRLTQILCVSHSETVMYTTANCDKPRLPAHSPCALIGWLNKHVHRDSTPLRWAPNTVLYV